MQKMLRWLEEKLRGHASDKSDYQGLIGLPDNWKTLYVVTGRTFVKVGRKKEVKWQKKEEEQI